MDVLVGSSAILLPVLYTLLVVAYAQLFIERTVGLVAVARPLLLVTTVIHGFGLVLRAADSRACPVASASEVFSLVAFIVLAIYLALEWRLGKRNSTGVFVTFVAFALQLTASVLFLGARSGDVPALGLGPSFHIFAGIVGVAAVVVSSIYGLLFLMLYGAIKSGRFGLFYRRMPDLESLSTINFWSAIIAFAFLSLTASLGIWSSFRPASDASALKLTVSVSLWVLYGGAVFGHRFFGLGGKRLAYSTLLGFVLGAIALVAALPAGGGD